MDQTIEKKTQVKLINRTKKLVFKPGEKIEIQLEASCNVPSNIEFSYHWKYQDNRGIEKDYGTTKGRQVMLTFPNFYCEREMVISVHVNNWEIYAAKQRELSKDSFYKLAPIDNESSFLGYFYDSIKIVPVSEKQFLSVNWYEQDTVLDYTFIPIQTNKYFIAFIELTGFNGKSVDVKLYVDKPSKSVIGYSEYRSYRVVDNAISMPVHIEDKYFQNDPDKTKRTLRIIISYKGKHFVTLKKELLISHTSIVERIDSTPLVPVFVGDPYIVDNNFNPCKYTGIKASYESGLDKKLYTQQVFDEIYNTEVENLNIIGGNRNIKIDLVNYKTNSCKIKKHHPINKALLYLNGMKQNIDIENKGKLNFNLKYDYKISLSDLLLPPPIKSVELKLLPFIWPKRTGLIQPAELAIDTCRHHKTLVFDMFPDIKWKISFYLTANNAYEIRHKNLPGGHRFEQTQKEANKVGNLNKGNTFKDEFDFGISLIAQWDDEKCNYDLSLNYIDKIKFFVGLFSKIKQGIDMLMGCGSNKSASELKKIANKLPKSKFCPIILTIEYPNIEIGGEWWLEMNKEQKAQIAGSIEIAASPLLSGSGGLDLIALATYIPVAGQIIKALDWSLQTLGTNINLSVELFGEISFALSHKFLPEDGVTELYSKAKLGVKVKASVSGQVGVIFVFKADFELAGMAESYFTFAGTIGHDKDGCYLAPEITFSGIILVLLIKIKVKKKDIEKEVSILVAGRRNKNGEIEKVNIVDKYKYYIIKK